MGVVNPRRLGGGAHLELVRVPAASVATVADNVDLMEAATLLMNGLTARASLEALGCNPPTPSS